MFSYDNSELTKKRLSCTAVSLSEIRKLFGDFGRLTYSSVRQLCWVAGYGVEQVRAFLKPDLPDCRVSPDPRD